MKYDRNMRDRNQSLVVVLAKESRARKSKAHDRIPLASSHNAQRTDGGKRELLSGQEVDGRETSGSCPLLPIVFAR